MTHASTPWEVSEITDSNYDVPAYQIGRGPDNNYERLAYDLTKEHAELIASACNAHDALVAALEAIHEAGRCSDNSRAKYMSEIAENALKLARGEV